MTNEIALRAEREQAITEWLLRAARDPQATRNEWKTAGIALLQCGLIFSAVRIPADIVRAAVGSPAPADIHEYLADHVGGPVFVDTYAQRYYALVPPLIPNGWWAPAAVPLDANSYLGVPAPDRVDPERGRSAWCVPVVAPGVLCAPGAVADLAKVGHRQFTLFEGDGK